MQENKSGCFFLNTVYISVPDKSSPLLSLMDLLYLTRVWI